MRMTRTTKAIMMTATVAPGDQPPPVRAGGRDGLGADEVLPDGLVEDGPEPAAEAAPGEEPAVARGPAPGEEPAVARVPAPDRGRDVGRGPAADGASTPTGPNLSNRRPERGAGP
jgi:hypothetical protein